LSHSASPFLCWVKIGSQLSAQAALELQSS
jgi:hypothetical protein